MKLAPWFPKDKRTVWVDVRPGVALVDVLAYAERERAERVMLAGPIPPRPWFWAGAQGWSHGAHFLDARTPVGRYVHDQARVTVEVRTCAEWFGAGDYTATDARAAWAQLGHVLGEHVRGASLFSSPGATGMNAWLLSRPRTRDGELVDPPQVPDDLARLIRATSTQHRIELLPPATDTMPGLWYMDGRWMFAALCNELGSAPARHLATEEECEELWHSTGRPGFARARYRVTFRAPDGWDTVGLLMVPPDDEAGRWHAPLSGQTWADAAEVELARRMGWAVQLHEGIEYTPGRPLDTWAKRLIRARDAVLDDTDGPQVARLVRGALRSILLQSIGAWTSTGRYTHTVTDSPMTPPAGDGWEPPTRLEDGSGFLWRRHNPQTGRAAAMLHPEWTSQIWARARVRVLDAPAGDGRRAGALYLHPGTLVAIYGDAVMTTRRPTWADADDGKPGRLRIKGHLCGPLPWPTTPEQRDQLARAADAAGSTCEGDCP